MTDVSGRMDGAMSEPPAAPRASGPSLQSLQEELQSYLVSSRLKRMEDAGFLRLAAVARRAGHYEVAIHAMQGEIEVLMFRGLHDRAQLVCGEGMALARKIKNLSLLGQLMFARACGLFWSGQSGQAFKAFRELLIASDIQQAMPAVYMQQTYVMLCDICHIVDPHGLPIQLMDMALSATRMRGLEVPSDILVIKASHLFTSFALSDPSFQGALPVLQVDPARRARLMPEAMACLDQAWPLLANARVPLMAERARLVRHAVAAMLQGSVDELHAGADYLRRQAIDNSMFDLWTREHLATAAILLKRPELANSILNAAVHPQDGGVTADNLAGEYQLLWFVLHRELQQTDQALAHYMAHVRYWTESRERLQMSTQEITSCIELLARASEPGAVPGLPGYLDKAIRLMQEPGGNLRSVASLAAQVGVSQRTLREAFLTHFATSPKRYALNLRLEQAHARAMREPGATVAAIAADLGFSNPARLATAFRQRYGVGLSELRGRA